MHIAFCCDSGYLPHCATVIASIIDNNIGQDLNFHIVGTDLSKRDTEKIKKWGIGYGEHITINIHIIDEDLFRDFPVGEAYVNISTYFRLYLPDLLVELDKVLYLDCDIIVNGSLQDLWNTELGDKTIAGVLDRHSGSIRLYNRLEYPLEYGYINAGVLLINLKRWREDDIFKKALSLAIQKPERLKNHDQDILNILYFDKKEILDFRYNLLEYYLYVEDWLYMDRKFYPQIIEACKNPVIIHFCMPIKPWHYECINPFKALYHKYRAMTPWPELKLTHRKEKLTKKLKLKRLLGRLGLYHIESKATLRENVNMIEDPDNLLF